MLFICANATGHDHRGGLAASAGLLALLLVTPAPLVAAEASSPPNVIFVLVDDLGYGDYGVFHQNLRAEARDRSRPWHRTPALDRLAAEGMQLPHHYCPAPVCAPSRASLLLGVHQGHANVRDNQFDKQLEDNHTLATVLRAAGYKTAAIGKYGLQGGQESEQVEPPNWPAHPNRRGFDEFYGYIRHRDGHEHYPKEGIHRGAKEVWHNMREVSAELDNCYTTDLFTARAKHFIASHVESSPQQPFFLYLAYDTPHAVLSLPTQAYPDGGGSGGGLQWLGTPGQMINTASGTPDSYYHDDYAQATWDHDGDPQTAEIPWPDVQKRYATVVRRIDDAVGDLMQLLADLKIADNTLVVFTTDNGPSVESYLDERYEPTFFQAYGPYDGIKRDVLEGGVHVGALARWPAKIPAGSTSGELPTAFWDWLPTFAEAAGLTPPARSDGVSLMPLLTGTPQDQRPSTIYVEYFQRGRTPQFDDFDPSNRGRRRNQMQLIRQGHLVGLRYDIQSHADDFEIYDVINDPRQSNDLAAEMPQVQAQMKDHVLRLRRPNASARRPYDEQAIPSIEVAESEPGVRWAAGPGEFAWVPWLDAAEMPLGGSAEHLDGVNAALAAQRPEEDGTVAVLVDAWLEVPEQGRYSFALQTQGRAVLRLHQATLIDADAPYQSGEVVQASVELAQGKHPLQLWRLVEDDQTAFQLDWSGPGGAAGAIPATAWSRSP